jgi:hypothetical protein
MEMRPNRRRLRLVDRRLQLGLAAQLLIAYLVFQFLGILVAFAPSMWALSPAKADKDVSHFIASAGEFLALETRMLPAAALVAVGIVVYTLVISHRIVGPVYRIDATLKRLIDGDYPEEVRFRKHDYFVPTASLLTELSAKLRASRAEQQKGPPKSGSETG